MIHFKKLRKFEGLEMTKITVAVEFWHKNLQWRVVYLIHYNS